MLKTTYLRLSPGVVSLVSFVVFFYIPYTRILLLLYPLYLLYTPHILTSDQLTFYYCTILLYKKRT